ncbi:hypothetical protein [Alphaproteobacteria bacterium endosymbiont of Tiliacea citrago]|uniref:hypothetical protein n=1 Tax=Alphaproteobacteria bacterium endosymbiont of Tiliacea citrago TaxID=3077944 RepID=UPI00313E28A4
MHQIKRQKNQEKEQKQERQLLADLINQINKFNSLEVETENQGNEQQAFNEELLNCLAKNPDLINAAIKEQNSSTPTPKKK